MSRPITRLFLVFAALFAVLVGFTSYWSVFDSESLDHNPKNARSIIQEARVKRGTIRADDGEVLARSVRAAGKTFRRTYPQPELFPHEVGYSFLTRGRAGLEEFYNDELAGRKGEFSSIIDQLEGRRQEGEDLKTTLDPQAQRVALNGLAGRAGSVVALVPSTGEVKVMASVPSYDPNDVDSTRRFRALTRSPAKPLVNRSIASSYPPGSTFKVVTAAAALDTGKFTPTSTVNGANGQVFSGVPLNNFGGEDFGSVDLTFALTNSINTAWANVGTALGKSTMAKYMKRFGFYKDPPVDLPKGERLPSGEYSNGRLLDPESDKIDVARMAIGQDKLSVTPLQMAMVASAIANGGVLVKPHIGDRFVNSDGTTTKRITGKSAGRVISKQAATELGQMMSKVVEEGTGTAAALEGISVAGKTGTAEIDPAANLNQPWFIAFAPVDNPKIAIAVTIERSSGGTGGEVAAPIAKQVLQSLLGRVGVTIGGGPRGLSHDEIVDGRYRVIERIGSGGMADVWLAEDQQLGRRVALKLLHRRFAEDPEFVARFKREASAAGGLQHANVVGVYDRGEWEGTSYIAMEYLEGSSLKRVITENAPLDPVWAIDVCLQVLRAARFAHRAGIIHRDIKPHNVIVDGDGHAKVTDFGIARAGASDMTETGSIMGTAHYIAPEQAQGHGVSAASDLYSVGIMLYEMLAGRVPFDGESAVTIALKQVSEPPVPPSQYADVPPDLEAVVMRALEKDPARRFADADEFIVALEIVRERIVSGADPGDATAAFGALPPPLEPSEDEEEPGEAGRRRWPWVVAIGLIILVAAAALVFALTRPAKTVQVPKVTGLALKDAAAALENRGFQVSVRRVREDAPVDQVTRQDPQAFERVDEGSTVTLTVSNGPGTGQVPDVAGLSRDAAKAAIKRAGFKVKFENESSSSVPAGQATRSEPQAGTSLDKGSKVTVFLSSGPQQVTVPGLVGKDKDAAESQIQNAGLQVDVQSRVTSASPADTVLAQDPQGGVQVAKGSTVTITVAKAPPTSRVPDVLGDGKQAAKQALRAAGLRVTATSVDVTDPAQDGLVQSQDPGGGREVAEGTTVTIAVGRLTNSGGTTTGGTTSTGP